MLDLPEMNLHVEVTPLTASQDPTNFRSVSNHDQVAIVGRGIQDERTGEVISLVCTDRLEGDCSEVQPGSMVKKTLFVFGQKMSLAEAKKAFPAAMFQRNGWNWSNKPQKVSTSKFYRIKKRLAKRELKDFEKRGYWNNNTQWMSLGKRGCLADVQIDLASLQSSILMFDVQAQVAELFAQRYRCTDTGSVLKISTEMDETVSNSQRAQINRQARHGQCVQFGGYPYAWSTSISVTDAAGKKVYEKNAESNYWWRRKKAFEREFNAHDLLFKLIDELDSKNGAVSE